MPTKKNRPELLFGYDQTPSDPEQQVDPSLDLVGWLCGLGMALALASMYSMMRLLKDESSLLVNLHVCSIGALLLGVLATCKGERVALFDDPWPTLALIVVVGVFPVLLATVAASFADASSVAVGGQSAVVFALLLVRRNASLTDVLGRTN